MSLSFSLRVLLAFFSWSIEFINDVGLREAGVDGGGLFKEFIDVVCASAFDPRTGLWKETSDHLLYPNRSSGLIDPRHLQHFKFCGQLLGKAMYEGKLVETRFSPFFLNTILGNSSGFDDLDSLDPELSSQLLWLKHYTGDASELMLDFTTTHSEMGGVDVVPLCSNGQSIPLADDNKRR